MDDQWEVQDAVLAEGQNFNLSHRRRYYFPKSVIKLIPCVQRLYFQTVRLLFVQVNKFIGYSTKGVRFKRH